MKIKQLVIALLALSVLASAQEDNRKFSFSLRGGYFIPHSKTFNNELRPVINNDLKALEAYLKDFGLTNYLGEMSKMSGAVNVGGEVEIRASEQVGLALGVDYAFRTLTASLDSGGTVDSVTYGVTETGKIGLSVMPITATVRINLPFSVIKAYMGGGLGYYFARYTEKESWTWTQGEDTVDTGSRKTVATGDSVLPHAEVGAEYRLSSKVSLAAIIRCPFGSISSFKIKKAPDDPAAVGQKLTFTDSTGAQHDFKWELTGPVLGVNLKIKF